MNNLKITVTNNSDTLYDFIAITTKIFGKPLLVRWTDDMGTVYDIIFTFPLPVGEPNNGLYIGVVGYKGFIVDYKEEIHESYLAEKTGMPRNLTLTKFAELLNGVFSKLNKSKKICA